MEYPLGHRRRRTEGTPLLRAKFERAVATRFAPRKVEQILGLFDSAEKLAATPACEFMDLWMA